LKLRKTAVILSISPRFGRLYFGVRRASHLVGYRITSPVRTHHGSAVSTGGCTAMGAPGPTVVDYCGRVPFVRPTHRPGAPLATV